MTLDRAFDELLKTWSEQPKDFRDKYRSYRSKWLAKNYREVGIGKRREMLLESGWYENWTLIKDNAKSSK